MERRDFLRMAAAGGGARRRAAHEPGGDGARRRAGQRADRADHARHLRTLRRAPRRRRLRRRVGRRRLEDPEHARHPPGADRRDEEAAEGRDPLARRLLRRQLRLARRHRPARRAAAPHQLLGRRHRAATPSSHSKYDPNHFGSVDFARFCRLVGSEPYFAANLRSLPARDFYQWVEYCNSPAGTTSLADLRARDGEKDPLKVRYWGVGNESWGCGGDFTAEEYAVEFRRFTSWVPGFDTPLSYIASGPSSGDLNWTRGFFSKLTEKGPGMIGRVARLRPAPLHREPELRRSGQERLGRAQGAGASGSRSPSGTRSSRKPTAWST